MDSRRLAEGIEWVLEQRDRYNIHHLLLVKDGVLTLDMAFHPYDGRSPHDVASITKSITSLLTGLALESGHIESIDDPVSAYLSPSTGTRWDQVRLRDILSMRSGFRHRSEAEAVALMQMSQDWVNWALERDQAAAAGGRWFYNSIDVHLLSGILHEASGLPTERFASTRLFEPLGIEDFAWPRDPQGVNHGWGDLQLIPTDLARIGQMILQGGRWRGEPVLGEHWIEQSLSATPEPFWERLLRGRGYGLLWWTDPDGSFRAIGRGGQLLALYPEQGLVVVMLGGGGTDIRSVQTELIRRFILPAISTEAPVVSDADRSSELHTLILRASREEAFPAPALQSDAGPFPLQVREGRYRFGPNPLGLVDLELVREDQAAPHALRVTIGLQHGVDRSGGIELVVLPDAQWHYGTGRSGNAVRARLVSAAPDELELYIDEIAGINRWIVRIRTSDDGVMFSIAPAGGGTAAEVPVEIAGSRL